MPKAESVVALALVGLSVYLMVHATVLPIWWVRGSGPGGGAFPFWLSALMLFCSTLVLVRSLIEDRPKAPFFDPETLRSVLMVAAALVITIALVSWLGTYVAFALFLLWYLKIFGGHGWVLTLTLIVCTLVFIFFFFEVTLRILLPKGVTEPLFLPLYQIVF